ncbi:hypothetical protein RN001_011813 [Aquatica leii]|uniref:Nuclease HARBI1 n=1 Tax=Aquatica leii TaxID=1421715 RepID=A0AAN7P6D1_9COLE|nr:hypothetical protein RN001_011813 [Aquatica leii]
MLLLTLRFYASSSCLIVMEDFIGVHKSTACETIHRVSIALPRIRQRFIKMPSTAQEVARFRQGFFNIGRFPRCVGAIDCTHIKIQSPGGGKNDYMHLYPYYKFYI